MSTRPPKHTSTADAKTIEAIVESYSKVVPKLKPLALGITEQLLAEELLGERIHFIRNRVKDPEHLRTKLMDKANKAASEGKPFEISPDNLYSKITDLIGIRILYLHTQQFPIIHNSILQFLADQRFKLLEKPFAVCWDTENRKFYRELGLKIRDDDSMYTSVHYVFALSQTAKYPCELQVRTVMDEVWGEVSHTVNYPTPSSSDLCNDQLKILARLTSGCVRLVDAIFLANDNSKSDQD